MKKIVKQTRKGDQRVQVDLSELLQLSQNARFLSLSALRRPASQSGQHMSRLLARGMEFAESRRYQSGDDIRNIDWRVTARTGRTHTKLFAAEKERSVLISVDMQSSMFFASRGVFKSVQAAMMMGSIAWSAALAGDRLGGIIFDGVNFFESRPALGKKGVFPFLHALAEQANFLQTKIKRTLPPSEEAMDQAITHLHQVAKPGSLIFMVSDFRHLTSYAQNLLIQISLHSDLCLCFIYDQLERQLPRNDNFPVKNGKIELDVDTYTKGNLEKYHQQFIERRAKVASLTTHRHIHFIECGTEEECFDVLMKHFSKR